jgi:hypothetical protein
MTEKSLNGTERVSLGGDVMTGAARSSHACLTADV